MQEGLASRHRPVPQESVPVGQPLQVHAQWLLQSDFRGLGSPPPKAGSQERVFGDTRLSA